MQYRVMCQNLCRPKGEAAHEGDVLSASELGGADNIKDLIRLGAILPLEPAPKTLDEMSKTELVTVAVSLGLDVKGLNKDDVLAAIKQHQAAAAAWAEENAEDDGAAESETEGE